MSAARDEILGRIRDRRGGSAPSSDLVAERLADHSPWIVPGRARGAPDQLVARFIAMAEEVSATVARIAALADVPRAVEEYLLRAKFPAAVVCPPDPLLEGLPWQRVPSLSVRFGIPADDDAASVTGVVSAIAETGTLLIRSGPANPNTLHFLPEAHIALVPSSAIVGAYEDAWSRLRAETGATLPRVATLITGPSRSSDIERTLAIGVHGPRKLHIVVVDGA